MVILELPWPPSVNHYWRMGHNRIYLGSKGRLYKAMVAGIVRYARPEAFTGDVSVEIEMYPPDRRRRDCDNPMKAILDSLGKAGLYEDDNQVKHIQAWMLSPADGGKVIVRVDHFDPERIDPPSTVPVPCN